MKTAAFTIRVLGPNPHRENTQVWRAGMIVTGMQGCRVESIVQALKTLETDTRDSGEDDPARWLTHFAGLESSGSGKAIDPWIQIIHDGTPVTSTAVFRKLLKSQMSRTEG